MGRLDIVGAASAAAWAVLVGGRSGFWRLQPRFAAGQIRDVGAGRAGADGVETGAAPPGEGRSWPAIAVVIPARNEADLLPTTLPSVLGQDYPGPLRVVVVDDRSDDGTGGVARSLAAQGRHPCEVVEGRDLPPGWAGKVWALQQGVEVARRHDPDLYLFTDADIRHPGGSLTALACLMEASDLVSVMARLQVASRWERLLVPAFVYFFALLYPFARVGDPQRTTAAAAGGCLLVRRPALDAAGGLEAMAGAIIDDVTLAQLVHAVGGRLWLGASDDVVSCRRCDSLAQVWDMVARSADTQLRHSLPLLAGTVAGMALLFVAPVVAAVGGTVRLAGGTRPGGAAACGGAAAWALQAVSAGPVLRLYGLSRWRGLLQPIAGVLYTAMTIDSAVRHRRGTGGTWKGRTSRAPARSRAVFLTACGG